MSKNKYINTNPSERGQIRKMQTAAGGPLKWQRVKSGNNYGYVQVTKDNRPIDYDSNTGQFRIYNSPDTSSYSYMTEFKDNTKNINRQNPEYIYETSPLNEVVVTGKIKNSPSTLNESIVTGNQKSSNYKSVYHPEDAIEFFNAVTLGGLNNLSPTQWARRIYDTGKLATGNMSQSQYVNSLVNGNSGLVSEKFEKEHPYLSTGINIVGDILPISLATTPLNTVNKIEQIGKKYIIPSTTGVTTGMLGMYIGDNLSKYLPEEHKDISKPLLLLTMGALGATTGIESGMPRGLLKTKYTKINDVINYPLTTAAATFQGKYPWTRRQDFRLKRQLFNDIEEARVWQNNSGYDRIYQPSIEIQKRDWYSPTSGGSYSPVFHHITVQPTFHKYSNLPLETGSSKLSNFKGVVNHELTHGRQDYFGSYAQYDPESGYYIARNDLNMESLNPFKLKKKGSWIASPDEFDSELSNLQIITGKNAFESIDDISPLAKRFSISKQQARNLETDILNVRKSQKFFKQGGKMNVIEQFKKGYKIKIKESQKGSFTKYCNGKVTNECIQRGKNSPNPKIRKKATFAQNARRWKHQLGGQLIKAEDGTKFLSKQWFQNAGKNVNNFLSSDAGKFAINAGQQVYSNISSGIKQAETKDRLQKWKQAYVNSIEPKDFSQQVAEEERQIKLANPDYNISPIVSAYKENILATQAANKAKQKASQEADQIIMQQLLNQNESSNSGGGFGSLLTEGLGLAGQFLSSKKSTGTNTGTINQSTYKWTLNGSPSTYTPSQNTSNVYTGFNLATPVLSAPTIPIKYNNFTL